MGISLRAQAVQKQRNAARHAARIEAEAQADEIRRSMLSRDEAARYLGMRPSSLRDLYAAGRGPKVVKFGHARQSRVKYPREELDRWRLDPIGYDTPARDPAVGPFEPPRRGGHHRGPKP